MNISFITLGCKVNQYETEVLMDIASKKGFSITDNTDISDIILINSCTVTQNSDKKLQQLIKKFNKNKIIAVTGCYPQAFPQDAKNLKNIDVLTGSNNKTQTIDYIIKFLECGCPIQCIIDNDINTPFEPMQASTFIKKTRAFVKIQDGCNKYCTYCIIPTARGPIRSKYVEDIITELSNLAKNGYKEVVLVGINLCLYGKDINSSLLDIIKIAQNIDGIERIRLGSLEPNLISMTEISELANLSKFCPQFHLSLQSGCDETLRRMNRHYDTELYYQIVSHIRKTFDNPSITTDIMVGFPGETEKEFQKSIQFSERIAFSKMHVFSYSKRAGTKASIMPNQISNDIKKQRNQKMISLANTLNKAFLDTQIGKIVSVLFESNYKEQMNKGLSPNYTPIKVYSSTNLEGSIHQIKILGVQDNICTGEIYNSNM